MQSARRAIDAVAANDLCAMQTCGVRQVRCPLIGVSRTCAWDGARSEKCQTTDSYSVDIAASFEHSVRAYEDCFGDADPEGFRGLEVHDQFEPRRALDGKVCRLGAA
jgi:hypothetical protein